MKPKSSTKLRTSRNDISARINSAVAFLQQEKFDQAEAQCRSVLRSLPKHFDAMHMLGVIHAQQQRHEQAIECLARALSISPDHGEARKNLQIVVGQFRRQQIDLAVKFHQSGQLDRAEVIYESILTLDENHLDALQLLGAIAAQRMQPVRALELLDRAIALKPDCAEAWSNRGNALRGLKQLDAAVASYDRAIAFKPDYAEAWSNRGVALQALTQLDAAVASFDQAITFKPDYAEAYWNKSLALLLKGDFDGGWPLHEWRWKNESLELKQRNFSQPLWLGAEPVDGKTILLYSEQGLGDTLQFCRYASRVAERGGRVILEVPEPLVDLLQGLEGVSELVAKGSTLPAFDFHCPLLSLPLAFKTSLANIPRSTAYLHSDPSKVSAWAAKLGAKTKPRVGIAWSGSAGHKNDSNRSISLSELIAQLSSDCEYISLQKEVRDTDRTTLAANPHIKHFGAELKDFTDTSALCDLMDVVVSVDTSVAHLSGALGKPTWVLLPFSPDWRWLLDRDDTPWYPSATLYRQQASGDWAAVLERVRDDLAGPALANCLGALH